ncbi:COPZ1 [Branchiostoma lanceolatum]|uniref:Coatomer subunit zeta n=1 Tax=Branchiostoma lanceolatum TaxID=7740 RepID=A0A8J9YNW3_BRALA|nr:COPZ1 [Branchiostoma lanceolatum]
MGKHGHVAESNMDAAFPEPSLYTIKAIAILDNDGERIVAKYFDETFPTAKEQRAFEKNLFNKTHRANAEIIMLEGITCVYRSNVDLFFYVMGSSNENELILASVLNCLYDSVSQMLRKNVEKRALMDNLDGVFLAVDEIVDGGIILEADPNAVVQRVALRTEDVPLTEQTVAQVRKLIKDTAPGWLKKGTVREGNGQ